MITILRFILLFLITSISTLGVQVEQRFIWDALGNLIGVELTDDRIDPDGRINISAFQNQKQLISFPSGFNQWNVFRSDTKFDANYFVGLNKKWSRQDAMERFKTATSYAVRTFVPFAESYYQLKEGNIGAAIGYALFDAATMEVGGIAAKGAVKGSRALSAGFRYGSKASDSFASGYRTSSSLSRSGGARLDYFEYQYSRTIATKTLPGPRLPGKVADTFVDGAYANRKLATNETLYKYHGVNNRTGRQYSWFTNKKYASEADLRADLAIRKDWGVQINKVSEFDVPAGSWVSEGRAAAQGAGYPGGGYQAVISEVPNAWVIRTNPAF